MGVMQPAPAPWPEMIRPYFNAAEAVGLPSAEEVPRNLDSGRGRGRPRRPQDTEYIGTQFQNVASPWPDRINSYFNAAEAAGLPLTPIRNNLWHPPWSTFRLRVFRDADSSWLEVRREWDDEVLLTELVKKYNGMRTILRRLFSLKCLRAITMVPSDITPFHAFPQLVMDPPDLSQGLRFQHYLQRTDIFRGRHDFMGTLTADPGRGILFLEQWSTRRISFWVISAVFSTLVFAIVYSVLTHDVSTAFTIAGYMAAALSVLGILVGVLTFIKFR
ncbi:hypothetical protein JAAARDRAFT_197424 [Jaapia argillacea MUCL 33604]|uniref:Uncharacterized protein n=1 Tax=Jaapia argillacea MUCL 33604 TaxID=933084 RepID=A0A067PTF2_9AGAM|nr:hypothetical protein JAAARDRAFT_197424 [Jaapia argillacea MUCL 33604]